MTTDALAPSELQIQQALKAALGAVERGDHAGALKVFKAIYEDPRIAAPPDGLSGYGLCLALVENQTKRGMELCRSAITTQFYDSRHVVNLVNLHLKKGNKLAAVETVKEALSRMPEDAAVLALKGKLGIRQAPPIRFLSHENVLNRMLSRGRQDGKRKPGSRRRLGPLHPAVTALIALIFFAAVFGGTFYFLYHQAYG
ncbi:MAG: hypothetical protein WC538_11280 [Thermoanaerobaculia bacterium]|jgi:hypothetical protein